MDEKNIHVTAVFGTGGKELYDKHEISVPRFFVLHVFNPMRPKAVFKSIEQYIEHVFTR